MSLKGGVKLELRAQNPLEFCCSKCGPLDRSEEIMQDVAQRDKEKENLKEKLEDMKQRLKECRVSSRKNRKHAQ